MHWVQQLQRLIAKAIGLGDAADLAAGLRRDHDELAREVARLAVALNRTTSVATSAHQRLRVYESHVPAINKLARARETRLAREAVRDANAAADSATAGSAIAGSIAGGSVAPEMAVSDGA